MDDLGEVHEALDSADYELGEFVFASDYSGLADLKVDTAGLIGGIGVFRVLSREESEAGEVVRVEEALLTDVIENGDIAWRRSFVSAKSDSKLGLRIGESEAESIRQLRQPLGPGASRTAS